MPRTIPYLVPTDILADQGLKIFALYKEDSADHKHRFTRAGLPENAFKRIGEFSQSLFDLEVTQEERKIAAQAESAEATAAVQAMLRWRLDEALSRARVIFEDDPRLIHFRSGKLRSHRPSAVAREIRLLLVAVERFKDLPEAQAIGLDEPLLREGERLLEKLLKEDTEGEVALALQVETTALLREKEIELSNMLADVEKRATIAFPYEHVGRRRYRMNEIRRFVAMQKGRGGSDPSAAIFVEDPAPEPVLATEPVDA